MFRVLIVDDSPEDVALWSGILKAAAYEVSSAPSPEAALGMVKAEKYDVVLLDNRFDKSRIVGLETIQEFIRSAPVIMLSAFGDEDTKKDAELLGAHVYLTKPVEPETLLRSIAELVAK